MKNYKILVDKNNGVIVATGTKNIADKKREIRNLEMESNFETSKSEILNKIDSMYSIENISHDVYKMIRNDDAENVYNETGLNLYY